MSWGMVWGASGASNEAWDCIPGLHWPACSDGGTADLMTACAGASRVEVTRRAKDIQESRVVELQSRVGQGNAAIRRSGRLSRRGELPLCCQVHPDCCIVVMVALPSSAWTWHEMDACSHDCTAVHGCMAALAACVSVLWLHSAHICGLRTHVP